MPPYSSCSYTDILGSWSRPAAVSPGAGGTIFCGAQAAVAPFNAMDVDEMPPSADSTADERLSQSKHNKPLSKTPTRPSKRVRFVEEVDVLEIPNIRELPKSHLAEIYMTKDEMAKIHGEAWEIVELMNLGIEYDEQDSFSKRGLVDLKDECIERRKKMRERAYKVVFGAQAFRMQQKDLGLSGRRLDYDEKSTSSLIMADLYHQVAAPAQSVARQVAMWDAMAATEQRAY